MLLEIVSPEAIISAEVTSVILQELMEKILNNHAQLFLF
jgi:hypothetical protein